MLNGWYLTGLAYPEDPGGPGGPGGPGILTADDDTAYIQLTDTRWSSSGKHEVSTSPSPSHTYPIHMQVEVQGVQQGQAALEAQVVQTLGVQVGPENQQVLEDPQWTHL